MCMSFTESEKQLDRKDIIIQRYIVFAVCKMSLSMVLCVYTCVAHVVVS